MKFLNFATVTVLQFLTNLQSVSWHLILILKHNFSALLQRRLRFERAEQLELNNNANVMDQEEQGQGEAPLPIPLDAAEQDLIDLGPAEAAPAQQDLIDLEEPPVERMDEDPSDVDDDILDYFSSDTETEGDTDDDLDNEDDIDENDNDDELDAASDSDWTRRLTQGLRRTIYPHEKPAPPRPPYAFQPLRLIKRNYKHRKMACDFPLARSGHRVIASESHLFSLGGYNPRSYMPAARRGQCLLFQELWCYNFATNRWQLLLNATNAANMPRELASNALAIHNNVLISHGGSGYPFGEVCSNDCYVYTTGDTPLVTRLKVTGDLPTAQYGPGIVLHEEYLYTIGGTTGFDYSCDVYRLNLTTKVWENVYICRPEMRDDPEGRYRHEVVYDGRHIFVLGGGTSHSVYDLQRIPAFNLKTNRWDYFDTMPDRTVTTSSSNAVQDAGFPKPRKCFSCVQHTAANGDIEAFITGGLQGDFTTYFADVWKLNLSTKLWTWIRTASLPKPLYFHSAAHSGNGCMYIFGGIEYSEKEMRRRNDLYKMWLTIPKLSEMCWDAITYYNRDLDQFDRGTLLKSGLPDRFVQRLPMLRQRKRLHSQSE